MKETGRQDKEAIKVLRLQKKLTFYQVGGLREELLAAGPGKLILDLSQVEECDAAGIQLLLSLSKGPGRTEKPILVGNLSGQVESSMAALGIAPRQERTGE
jgi:anti-anti-sigma regulatory factor